MNAERRPRLGKGIKLHHNRDGGVMLLVPEGALVLNPSAAVALELADGKHTLTEIVDAIVERFDVSADGARDDFEALFDRLAQRGFILQ